MQLQNETLATLMNRKSVRVFEERAIAADAKEAILAAAMRAPTAGNSMLYSILDITDQALKDTLAITCDNQPFIAKAPLVLVFCADYHRWNRKFKQAGCDDVIEGGVPAPDIGDLLLATNDTVIAAHAACVAAESLGIGSCYIGDILENFEKHKALFNLPPQVAPVSMLVFGYPTQQQKDRAQPPRFAKEMVVFENTYRELSEEELLAYKPNDATVAFFKRKYISDFMVEMNRSSNEIVKHWKQK